MQPYEKHLNGKKERRKKEMNKVFKRLLSVMLALVMVVGMIPLSAVPTKAATISKGQRIYFDTNGVSEFTKDSAVPSVLFKDGENSTNGTWVLMTKVDGSDTLYYADADRDNVTHLQFRRSSSANADWNSGTSKVALQDGMNCYKISSWNASSWSNTGAWSAYTESGGGTTDTPADGTKRIYFDTRNYLPSGWANAYLYMWNADSSGTTVTMNPIDGKTGLFYYDVSSTYTNVIFKPNKDNWSGQTNPQTIPTDDKNLFTCTVFSSTTSGVWGTYGTTDSGNNFPSNVTGKVTFFDLYSDTEIKGSTEYYGLQGWKYRVYRNDGTSNFDEVSASEGRSFTSIGRAFSNNVNKKISAYWTANNNSVYPLYFGNFQPFYMVEPQTAYDDNAVHTIDPWWVSSNNYKNSSNKFWRDGYMQDINSVTKFSWFLNRSVDVNVTGKDSAMYGAVVKGIAGDDLVNGNIVAKGTKIVLPQFNPQFYTDNPGIGKMYPTMDFPFVIREINGANYYQFDSGVNGSSNRDTVRMNDTGTALTYYSGGNDVVYGITGEDVRTPGFFPFNDPSDSTGNAYNGSGNQLNYGFGMKLEIEFTIDSDGKVVNNSGQRIPAVFEFSGDDDVWIYVDNKLALDLGGNHGVAQGKLDFSTNKAVVQYVKTVGGKTNASEAVSVEMNNYENKDYVNSMSAGTGVSENTSLNTSSGNNITDFVIDKNDPTKIHTLTIFYEERGMFESNFKATFNLEQPTVLKTTNTVDVSGVNSALQTETETVASKDTFTYEINDANSADVTGKKYTTAAGGTVDFNRSMTLKDGESATFTKQFDRASVLELIQTQNNRYKTSWSLSELSDSGTRNSIAGSYEDGRNGLTTSDSRVDGKETTAFKLENKDGGADESVPAKVQVDYIQAPQTGGIAIMKTMDEGLTSEDVFEFEVKISNIFGGGSAEAAYDLTYDIYSFDSANSTIVRKNAQATGGVVTLKANQFALISGIPVGTNYTIVEKDKVGYSVTDLDVTTNKSNDTNVSGDVATATVKGTVVADDSQNVDMFVYTNGIDTLDDAFLVEVGKTNTLNVIPTQVNDGTLTGDLKEISDAWTKSTAAKKGFVFIVNGAPYVDENGKPITSYATTDGVTYTVSTETGSPVITVTPDEKTVTGKNAISVMYQLVELNDDGTVKYDSIQDPTDETGETYIQQLAKITGVITMRNYLYKANDDVYVLDYGLDVDLAEKSGSGLFENDDLANSSLTGTTSTYWNTSAGANGNTASASTTVAQNTAEAKGTYGTITPSSDATNGYSVTADSESNPKVTYSMDKFLNGEDLFNYGVMIETSEAHAETGKTSNRFRLNVTSDVRVLPASVVYYEDNFNSDADEDSTAKIVYTGTSSTAGTSLTLTQSNGQTEQYGHDNAYNTTGNQQDSGGSSTKLTADGYNTKAVFTFTGTGFDILARTTDETAGIVYTIEKYDKGTGTYSLYRMGAVDTYYTNGDLYQLPVIHEDVEYGTYCVTLGIKQTGAYYQVVDEAGKVIQTVDTRKYFVYLDGIRIYNPLGVSGDDDYIASEQDATVSAISKLVVGNGTVTETGIRDEDGSTINGQVIDGANVAIVGYSDGTLEPLGSMQTEVSTEDSGAGTASILTYLNAGPNNEVYMDETAAMAFVVRATDETTNTLQVEVKLADTSNSEGSAQCAGIDLRVLSEEDGNINETVVENIKTSTAMYYSINVQKDCIALGNGYYLVVILGNSDLEDGGTHSLSFSNLKYKNYTIGNPYDTSNYDASEYIEASGETTTTKFVSIDSMAGLSKNRWYTYKHKVTLTENVFGVKSESDENGDLVNVQRDPEFKMYYTNAAGDLVEMTVYAKRVENTDGTYSDTEYLLRFKTPNAKGNFPVEIHYVVTSYEEDENGEMIEKSVESSEYISTTMTTR